jgi:HEAT repeat protein
MAQNEQEDIMVRRKAADALGDLGRVEEAGEILLAMAQDGQASSGTRRAACQSLKRLMGSPIE